MTTEVVTYLKYAELQMAAEAIFPASFISGSIDIEILTNGNTRSSKFTETQAKAFTDATEGWSVVDHKANTSTGFSGTLFKNNETRELVLSFRSTEFADDAARDNQATNGMEIRHFGYAFGQIADMQSWVNNLLDTNKINVNQPLAVTGYSLGGHLAGAFNEIYPDLATSTYTFNGAGIGKPIVGGLYSVIHEFSNRRLAGANLDLFTTSEVRSLYLNAYGNIRSTNSAVYLIQIADAIIQAKVLVNGFPVHTSANDQAKLLLDALTRSQEIANEAQRVGGLTSGNGNDARGVALSNIEAISLDYQLAVLQAGKLTSSYGDADAVGKAVGAFSRIDEGRADYFDIYGDTSPSMVSNSQRHLGTGTPIWIEGQPELRGNAYSSIYNASSFANGVKLLVPNFSQNDFGDTHSLVLLVDSLSVQNVLMQLDPSADSATLTKVLNAASNAKVGTGYGLTSVGVNNQGIADGDTLENLVNALGAYLGVDATSGWVQLKGDTRGGTWAEIDSKNDYTGRAALHNNLDLIANDPDYLELMGNVTIEPITSSLTERAKEDFGALTALQILSPFLLGANSAIGNEKLDELWAGSWSEEYGQWKADKSARSDGTQAIWFSDAWLRDRSALLTQLVKANQANLARNADNYIGIQGTATVNTRFMDIESNTLLLDYANRPTPTTLPSRYVVFGDGQANAITGATEADDLFGGQGNDTLSGLGGDDHLEGGSGNDAYIFTNGSGQDTVIDSDGIGLVRIGNDTLTGGKETAIDSRLWQSADKHYRYLLQLEGDGSQSLVILTSTAGDQITVRNFVNGQLGISLDGLPAPTPREFSTTIVGDRAAIDTNPNESGIQAGTDALDNVITDSSQAEPGRADALYDSGGDDLMLGLAGADGIYARRGGNDRVEAGSGDDYVEGGAGDDTILGGSGVDILRGDAGDDRLYAAGDVALSINQAILLGRSQTATDPAMLQGKSFSLTGYSLGGHLATAFNLLNPNAAKNFGDTHSLVLLVDSLNVQNALLQLLPTAQREAATGMVQGLWDSSKGKLQEGKGGVLQAASNLRAANGEFALGGGQGKIVAANQKRFLCAA